MSENKTEPKESKVRFQLWMSKETQELADEMWKEDNCSCKGEFIEKAIRFYIGYLSGQAASDYLPTALVSALRGTVQSGEEHICRLLFKQSVELSMMMNVLAAGMEIREEDLDRLRGKCVQEVKKSNGSLTLKDAVRYQNGR